MNVCLSAETISAIIEGTLPGPDILLAVKHMDRCAACSQLVSDMRDVETALRAGGDGIRFAIGLSDVDRVIQGALARAKEPANYGVIMQYGEKYLLDVLAPVCGERLTKHSMRLASSGTRIADPAQTPESEWKAFVHELGDILAGICGASVKNAVHHLSRQVLSGVA